MSRDRHGRRAPPPTQASEEKLAPGPFEQLFLKPSRPLDLNGISEQARDVFPPAPVTSESRVEDEQESVIFSPFTPATASPAAFPQPEDTPPVSPETGACKPTHRSFEELVGEFLPAPDNQQPPPAGRRRKIPLAGWIAAAGVFFIITVAFLVRERLAAIVFSRPAGVLSATSELDRGSTPAVAASLSEVPGELPPTALGADQSEVSSPGPVVEQRAPSQADLAPATPETPTTPAPALPPAGALTDVSWQTSDTGTEVVIRGDGAFAPGRVRVNALIAPPRVLVRLAGVRPGAVVDQRAVGTPEVGRLRLGYHAELSPPELYLVLDLTSPAVALVGQKVEGDTVRVTVQRSR